MQEITQSRQLPVMAPLIHPSLPTPAELAGDGLFYTDPETLKRRLTDAKVQWELSEALAAKSENILHAHLRNAKHFGETEEHFKAVRQAAEPEITRLIGPYRQYVGQAQKIYDFYYRALYQRQ